MSSTKPENSQTIGIYGGMGPETGSAFYHRLTKRINKKGGGDKSHPKVLLYSDPTMPRKDHSVENNDECLPYLKKGMDYFKKLGVKTVFAPCNTLMHYKSELEEHSGIKIIDIIQITAQAAVNRFPKNKVNKNNITKVGLIATTPTTNRGLYKKAFQALDENIEVILLDEKDQQHAIGIINDVKVGKHIKNAEGTEARIKAIMEKLEDKGAQAIVLGCTEFPLAYEHSTYIGKNKTELPVISSLDALIDSAMEFLKIKVTPEIDSANKSIKKKPSDTLKNARACECTCRIL